MREHFFFDKRHRRCLRCMQGLLLIFVQRTLSHVYVHVSYVMVFIPEYWLVILLFQWPFEGST